MPGIEARAPERTETSSGFDVAEALAGQLLDRGQAGVDLVGQFAGYCLPLA
jgi:hypothetical protein